MTSPRVSYAPNAWSQSDGATRSVPRVFQNVLVAYVLLTGELVKGVQAALFGLQGGGQAAFTAAVLLAIAIDIVRVAPLFLYARHPLGILHPNVHDYIVDEHIIYICALLVLAATTAGKDWGLGNRLS